LREFGGLQGIRDLGTIESSLARPYCGYYRPIEKKAAALIHSLILNHGFLDGNKRTAVYMLAILLFASGYSLRFNSAELLNVEVEAMILDVAEHRMTFDQIVSWIKIRLIRISRSNRPASRKRRGLT
jgi:death-on-curing protein